MKRRAAVRIVGGPQSALVRDDDGTTDGEPEPQSGFLGCEKRVEDMTEVLAIDTLAAIRYRGTNRTLLGIGSDDNFDTPIAGGICAHRFAGIQNEVEQYLLKFDAVPQDRWSALLDA